MQKRVKQSILLMVFYPLIQKRINRHFEIMFETGVDEMSWDDTVSVLATGTSCVVKSVL